MVTQMDKVVVRGQLGDRDDRLEDLRYWLAQTPDERISCVEILRRQNYGDTPRLQRVAQVIRGLPG
jgi:hypothetical protein